MQEADSENPRSDAEYREEDSTMTAWKPIASAPKDGRKLLLFARLKSDPHHEYGPVVGYWLSEQVEQWKPHLLDRGDELIPTWWLEIPELPNQ
jgi:hypothetical protein